MFENILGQDMPKNFIKKALENNKISHAYIFEGPKGIMKKEFAIEFSEIILKQNPLSSPDFTIVRPEKNSFKISQVRELIKDIYIKPYKENKIYIIEDAHKMTIQAQNSFLKTLEEPPSYAIIILICENINLLLDTIKSRCESVKFRPLRIDVIRDYLINEKNIEEKEASMLASFSSGIIKRAINLYESKDFNSIRKGIEKFLDIILSKKVLNILVLTKYLENNKDDITEILDLTISYFRDMMFVKEGIYNQIINVDRIDFIDDCSYKFSRKALMKAVLIIEDSKLKLNSNCNFNLTMETMLLNLKEVIK
ncbi:DNA polymerase III subunit delta' C-terminal domain-containing protein [Peptostreptococcaceae bacterium AGR-M142]